MEPTRYCSYASQSHQIKSRYNSFLVSTTPPTQLMQSNDTLLTPGTPKVSVVMLILPVPAHALHLLVVEVHALAAFSVASAWTRAAVKATVGFAAGAAAAGFAAAAAAEGMEDIVGKKGRKKQRKESWTLN